MTQPRDSKEWDKEGIGQRDIARRWKLDYSLGTKDYTNRVIEGVQKLVSRLRRPDIETRSLLEEAAYLIVRQLGIKEVSIGLRSSEDGLYRYEVIVGASEEAEKALRRITYTVDDFREDSSKYKGTMISKHTKLFLSEDIPYTDDEKDSYSRPVMLGIKRWSDTDSIEGDYLDILIYGPEEDIVGWMEVGGTIFGKLPNVTIIRWIELISSILGTALALQNARSGQTRAYRQEGRDREGKGV